MRDPCSLVEKGATYQEAAWTCLFAIWASVQVPDHYPILGAFKRLARRGKHSKAKLRPEAKLGAWFEDSIYKVRAAELSREQGLAMVADRYDLSEQDIEAMEEQILSVKVLPCVLCHPGFCTLRDVDYS